MARVDAGLAAEVCFAGLRASREGSVSGSTKRLVEAWLPSVARRGSSGLGVPGSTVGAAEYCRSAERRTARMQTRLLLRALVEEEGGKEGEKGGFADAGSIVKEMLARYLSRLTTSALAASQSSNRAPGVILALADAVRAVVRTAVKSGRAMGSHLVGLLRSAIGAACAAPWHPLVAEAVIPPMLTLLESHGGMVGGEWKVGIAWVVRVGAAALIAGPVERGGGAEEKTARRWLRRMPLRRGGMVVDDCRSMVCGVMASDELEREWGPDWESLDGSLGAWPLGIGLEDDEGEDEEGETAVDEAGVRSETEWVQRAKEAARAGAPLSREMVEAVLSDREGNDEVLQWLRRAKPLKSKMDRNQRYRNTSTDRAVLVAFLVHSSPATQSFVVEAHSSLLADPKKAKKSLSKSIPPELTAVLEALDQIRQWLRMWETAGVTPGAETGADAMRKRAARVRGLAGALARTRSVDVAEGASESKDSEEEEEGDDAGEEEEEDGDGLANLEEEEEEEEEAMAAAAAERARPDGGAMDVAQAMLRRRQERIFDGARMTAGREMVMKGMLGLLTDADAPSTAALCRVAARSSVRQRGRAAGIAAVRRLCSLCVGDADIPLSDIAAESFGSVCRLVGPSLGGSLRFLLPPPLAPVTPIAAEEIVLAARASAVDDADGGVEDGAEETRGPESGGAEESERGGDRRVPLASVRSSSLRMLQVASAAANRGIASRAALEPAVAEMWREDASGLVAAQTLSSLARSGGPEAAAAAVRSVVESRAKKAAQTDDAGDGRSGRMVASHVRVRRAARRLAGLLSRCIPSMVSELCRRRSEAAAAVGGIGGGTAKKGDGDERVSSFLLRGAAAGALTVWASDIIPASSAIAAAASLSSLEAVKRRAVETGAAWRSLRARLAPLVTEGRGRRESSAARREAAAAVLAALPSATRGRFAILAGELPKRDALLHLAAAAPAALGHAREAAQWLDSNHALDIAPRLSAASMCRMLVELRASASSAAAAARPPTPPPAISPAIWAQPPSHLSLSSDSASETAAFDLEAEASLHRQARALHALAVHRLLVRSARPETAAASIHSQLDHCVQLLTSSASAAPLEPLEIERHCYALLRTCLSIARHPRAAVSLANHRLIDAVVRLLLPPHPASLWGDTGSDLGGPSPRIRRAAVRLLARAAGVMEPAAVARAVNSAAASILGASSTDIEADLDSDSENDAESSHSAATLWRGSDPDDVGPLLGFILATAGQILCAAEGTLYARPKLSSSNPATESKDDDDDDEEAEDGVREEPDDDPEDAVEFGPGKARLAWASDALAALSELSRASPLWQSAVWTALSVSLEAAGAAAWDIVARTKDTMTSSLAAASLARAGAAPADVFRAVAAAAALAGPEECLRVGGAVRVLRPTGGPAGVGVILALGRTLFGELAASEAVGTAPASPPPPSLAGPGVGRALVFIRSSSAGSDPAVLASQCSIVSVELLIPTASTQSLYGGASSTGAATPSNPTTASLSATKGGAPGVSRLASLPLAETDALANSIFDCLAAAIRLPPPRLTDSDPSVLAALVRGGLRPVPWMTQLRLHALRALPALARQTRAGARLLEALSRPGSESLDGVEDAPPPSRRPVPNSSGDPWRSLHSSDDSSKKEFLVLRRPTDRTLLRPLASAALRPLLKSSLVSRGALLERRRTLHRWQLEVAHTERATRLLSPYASDADAAACARASSSLIGPASARPEPSSTDSALADDGSTVVVSSTRDRQMEAATNVAAATGKPLRLALAAVEMLPSASEAVEWLISGSGDGWIPSMEELARLDAPDVGDWIQGAAARVGAGASAGSSASGPLPPGADRRPGPSLASLAEEVPYKSGLDANAALEAARMDSELGDDDDAATTGSNSRRRTAKKHLAQVYADVLQTAGVRFYQVSVPEPRSGAPAFTLEHGLSRDDGAPGEHVVHGVWRGCAVTIAGPDGSAAALHRPLKGGEATIPSDGASLGALRAARSETGFARLDIGFWDEDTGGRLRCSVRHRSSADGAETSEVDVRLRSATRRAKERSWAIFSSSSSSAAATSAATRSTSTGVSDLPILRPRLLGGAVATAAAGLRVASLVTDDALCTLQARQTLLTLLQRFAQSSQGDAHLPLPTSDLVQLFRLVAATELQQEDSRGSTDADSVTESTTQNSTPTTSRASSMMAPPLILQQSAEIMVDEAVIGDGIETSNSTSAASSSDASGTALRSPGSRVLSAVLRRQLVEEATRLRAGARASSLELTSALVDEVARNVVGSSSSSSSSSSGSGGPTSEERETTDTDKAWTIQSLHPMPANVYFTSEVVFDGASSVRIEFDPRCSLLRESDGSSRVTIEALQGEGAGSTVRVLEGPAPDLSPVVVAADRIRVQVMNFPSAAVPPAVWGFRIRAVPLRKMRWQSERQVVAGAVSFEFGLFLLRFLAAAVPELVASGALHSPRILNALTRHLFSHGKPYKRRVLNLLAQLLSTPQLLPGGGGAAAGASAASDAELERSEPLHFSIIAENLYQECEGRLAAIRARPGVAVPRGLLQLLELAVLGRRAAYHLSSVGRTSGGLRSVPMAASRFDALEHAQERLPAWPPDDSPTKMLSWTMGICAALRSRWPLPELFLCSVYSLAHNQPYCGPGMPGALRRKSQADLIAAQKLIMSWTREEDDELMRWLHAVAKRVDKSESDLTHADWGEVPAADRRAFPRLSRHIEVLRPRMLSLRLRCATVALLNKLFRVVLPYVDTEVLGLHTDVDASTEEETSAGVEEASSGGESGAADGGQTRWTMRSEEPPPSEMFTPAASALATLGRKGDDWSLSNMLGSVSHLMLSDCKQPHVDEALTRTAAPGNARRSSPVRLHNGTALRSMNNGWSDPERSESLFVQLAREVIGFNDSALRVPLDGHGKLFSVKFLTFDNRGNTIEEEGIDAGGLYRAAISQAINDLFTPSALRLMRPAPKPSERLAGAGTFIPDPQWTSVSAMQLFEGVGVMIGIAVRTGRPQAFQFPALVWKRLLGQRITLNDVRQIDEPFAVRIQRLLDDAKAVDRPKDPVPGAIHIASAPPFRRSDNVSVPVSRPTATALAAGKVPTKEAVLRYCREAIDFRGRVEAENAYTAMRRGLGRVVPPDALGLLTWRELETLAAGEKDVDIDRLKQHAQYITSSFSMPHGQYSAHHPVIQRLWTTLESFSNEERVLFLEFIWGRSRLPPVGQWPEGTHFKIGPLARSDQRRLGDAALPICHTCFMQIELPCYSSERVMKEKLLVAMHGSCGVIALA